jgi:predicted Zn finger-like uncharacterized protein
MIIKCPKCSTGYSIPENMIGEKPRKMRCSRCKNLFTIARRAEAAPSGYEEFTGQHHLPGEFAFLKESPAKEPPPQPEEPPPQPEETSPQLVQPAPPTPMPAQSAPIAPAPLTVTTEPTPPPPSAPEIYGGTASAWEMEAPLDLGGFTIANEVPPKGQATGKVIFVVVVLLVGFLVFVAYRNGWAISIPELGDQIAFAFSGAELEDLPKEARDIEATINRRKIIMNMEKTPFLVIQGEVTNIATARRSKIIMRAQLIDAVGDIRAQVRAPCGKLINDSVIEVTPKGAMKGHYRSGGAFYNCSVEGGGNTVFQLIFDEVPADYDDSFDVLVQAVAAKPLD